MTEQQYRVIADRDKGDAPQEDTILVGDRYTFESVSNEWVGGDTDTLVRIERPVPTTDDENAWIDHELASPSLPTREQIAEALRESDRDRAAFSGNPWLHNADAVLALIQKEAER